MSRIVDHHPAAAAPSSSPGEGARHAAVRLLRPDGHGIMEGVFEAYATPAGGDASSSSSSRSASHPIPLVLRKGGFLALLGDLSLPGHAVDGLLRDGVWEVRAACARAAGEGEAVRTRRHMLPHPHPTTTHQ